LKHSKICPNPVVRTFRPLLALLILLFLSYCNEKEQASENVENMNPIKEYTLSLAKKYDAIYEHQLSEYRFTKELRDSLVISQKPIVLDGFLAVEDFYVDDTGYWLELVTYDPIIRFIVKCNASSFNGIYTQYLEDPYSQGVFVIKCNELYKTALFRAYPDDQYVSAYLEENTSFTATAVLLDH